MILVHPLIEVIQYSRLFKQHSHSCVAVKVTKEKLLFDHFDNRLTFDEPLEAEQLVNVCFTVLAVEAEERVLALIGVLAWAHFICPPPVLIDIVIVPRCACIYVVPYLDFIIGAATLLFSEILYRHSA